ncbi:uncharacterized protein LOC125946854 isoform X4 [Dermacentor silvarum]|uniref:uncharacterized protein LOC125946854 isoform X4 n=1 Tax=Dermacentor silvarum TaxID=543639 RepID=UPI002101A04C|nr:uncharacterized protein LOC125946854 isoform X4 [Dermacentor silvarum]
MKLERTCSYYFELLTFSFVTGITATCARGDTMSSAMSQTPDPRKQNEADVHLKVTSTGGSVMLNVEVVGTPPLKTVIEGNYRIHYADENCAVISSTRGTGVCTLWVQENTTSLPHADCKEAFSKNCQTCTTNQPAATS